MGCGDQMDLVCTLVHHLLAVCHWPHHLTHLQRRKAVTVFRGWIKWAHVAWGCDRVVAWETSS